jgi:8-oxo-dGTP pyrophosphatase MutT (NUDIX family)
VATREGTGGVEFLMVRHRERGWELPGGKVEGKEGPVHCALREFREETGHLLSEPRFVMKVRKPEATCFVFTGGVGTRVQAGGDSDRDEAVQETKWFRRLPKADLAFPDDPYDEIGAALRIAFR